jgi:hypothetical protein
MQENNQGDERDDADEHVPTRGSSAVDDGPPNVRGHGLHAEPVRRQPPGLVYRQRRRGQEHEKRRARVADQLQAGAWWQPSNDGTIPTRAKQTLEHLMSDLPIACTLGPAALKARREDLLGGLVRQAAERIDLPSGYRVRFDAEPGVLGTIASVIETERRCCRFLRFDLTVEPDERAIWLEFTGPPGTREFLAGMLDL